jgi:hypothetical protein
MPLQDSHKPPRQSSHPRASHRKQKPRPSHPGQEFRLWLSSQVVMNVMVPPLSAARFSKRVLGSRDSIGMTVRPVSGSDTGWFVIDIRDVSISRRGLGAGCLTLLCLSGAAVVSLGENCHRDVQGPPRLRIVETCSSSSSTWKASATPPI